MKTSSIVCLVLGALVVVGNYFAHYWLGYSESESANEAVNPFFGLLVEVALFLVLMILALQTIIIKKHRLWLFISLIGFWPLVVAAFLLLRTTLGPPAPLVAHGLCDRVMHDYTIADLRRFAHEVNQEIAFKSDAEFGKWISRGDTSKLTDTEKKAYARLKEHYSFLHFRENKNGSGGATVVSRDENIVNVEWGGPLEGHWGYSISADGSKNEVSVGPDTTVLRVSDDIYFFCGS